MSISTNHFWEIIIWHLISIYIPCFHAVRMCKIFTQSFIITFSSLSRFLELHTHTVYSVQTSACHMARNVVLKETSHFTKNKQAFTTFVLLNTILWIPPEFRLCVCACVCVFTEHRTVTHSHIPEMSSGWTKPDGVWIFWCKYTHISGCKYTNIGGHFHFYLYCNTAHNTTL